MDVTKLKGNFHKKATNDAKESTVLVATYQPSHTTVYRIGNQASKGLLPTSKKERIGFTLTSSTKIKYNNFMQSTI